MNIDKIINPINEDIPIRNVKNASAVFKILDVFIEFYLFIFLLKQMYINKIEKQ